MDGLSAPVPARAQVRGYRDKLVMLLAKSENDDRLIAALHGGPLLPDQALAAPPNNPPRVAFMRTLPAPPAEQPLPGDASFAANAVKAAQALLLRRPPPGGDAAAAPKQAGDVQTSTINIVLDFVADSSACVSIQGTVTSPTRCTITGAQLLPPPADAGTDAAPNIESTERACAAPCATEPAQAAAAPCAPEPAQHGAEEADSGVPHPDAAAEGDAAAGERQPCTCELVQDAPEEEGIPLQPGACIDSAAVTTPEAEAAALPIAAGAQPDAQASELAESKGFAGARAWALLDDRDAVAAAAVPHGIIIPVGQGVRLDLSRVTGSLSQAEDAVVEHASKGIAGEAAQFNTVMPEDESVDEVKGRGAAGGAAPSAAAVAEDFKHAEASAKVAHGQSADTPAGTDSAGEVVPVGAAEADEGSDCASRDAAEGAIDRVADYLYDYASALYTPRT